MISTERDILGVGIYTPAEAARFARVRTQLLNRWLFGSKSGSAVVRAQFPDSAEKVVTFLDFVQAVAIRSIRSQYSSLSLHKIRQAVEQAKKLRGVDYPFAMKHRTFVFLRKEPDKSAEPAPDDSEKDTDPGPSCEIILDDIQLTGKRFGNRIMREVAEVYMSDITYDSRGLASEYTAMRLGDLRVVMNPKKRFGEPLLPSGYTAEALWDAASAEGSIDAAAEAYGVDRREVELACRYFDLLQGPIAA